MLVLANLIRKKNPNIFVVYIQKCQRLLLPFETFAKKSCLPSRFFYFLTFFSLLNVTQNILFKFSCFFDIPLLTNMRIFLDISYSLHSAKTKMKFFSSVKLFLLLTIQIQRNVYAGSVVGTAGFEACLPGCMGSLSTMLPWTFCAATFFAPTP